MEIHELRVGNIAKDTYGQTICIIALPREYALVKFANYDGIWKLDYDAILPMEIIGEKLEDSGWEKKGRMYCLKTNPRLGWADGTLVVGYTEVPKSIRYVHELQNIMDFILKD